MNIVIVGAGKVGEVLCRDLTKEDHDITLIEMNEIRLEQFISAYDIKGIAGNGAMFETQKEAGVEKCDAFIAVTPNDETNIIAAITAKRLGAKYTIARVCNPEYSSQMAFLRDSLGISLMINPELEAAQEISHMIQYPCAINAEFFDNGRIGMIEVVLPEDVPVAGIKLKDLNNKFGNILICVVIRENQVLIPNGETCLQIGDHIMVTGNIENINTFCKYNQHKTDRINSALIIGGGKLTNYLIPKLSKMRIKIKVIEINPKAADKLAATYPNIDVICGDGTKQNFLKEERINDYDVVISLTGIDEENILISMFAASLDVKKTITKVNRTDLLKLLDNDGLRSIITPQRIIADRIIRFIRSEENSKGSKVKAFYRMADGEVEILEFNVNETSKCINVVLADLKIKKGVLISCIIRDEELIYPSGNDMIYPNDDVIIITTNKNYQDIDDILN